MTSTASEQLAGLGSYKFGWADSDAYADDVQRGLSEAVVRNISGRKSEPQWMLDMRLKGLKLFGRKPMPAWGADLSGIDFDRIKYFVRSTEKQAESWDDLPADIKNTYDRLGIPEAEKQRLIAGVAAQYECLTGDTRVWTANRGQVPIKEIEPGDSVFAYDETTERFRTVAVRAAAQTDVRQTYEVRVGSRKIRATDNHPVLALRDEHNPGQQQARSAPPLGDGRRFAGGRPHRSAPQSSRMGRVDAAAPGTGHLRTRADLTRPHVAARPLSGRRQDGELGPHPPHSVCDT